MTTDVIKSPVTRRTTATFNGRRFLVTLTSDDRIEMRLERRTETKTISVAELFAELSRHGAAQANVSIKPRRG